MTPTELLAHARIRGVKLELNAVGDGLAGHGNPPADLLERLTAAKPKIVAHLLERRRLLQEVEAAKPADASGDRWRTVVAGLKSFFDLGHGDEAERLGWTRNELYRVPPQWARIELCGVGLLVGDKTVESITADTIVVVVVTASGAIQTFRRTPPPDFAMAYRTRLKLIEHEPDPIRQEGELRALEAVVDLCRRHHGVDVDAARAMVAAAVKGAR